MLLKFKSAYSEGMLNAFRQCCMSCLDTTRPIAFKIGNDSNVIATNDFIVEDMTEFIQNVCDLIFVSDQEISRFTTIVDGCLDCSKFTEVGVSAIQNRELLHTLASTSVEIVFRRCAGNCSVANNVAFLEQHTINSDEYVVIPSRHCDIDNFSYTTRIDQDTTIYDIKIDTYSGLSEEKIFESVQQKMIQIIQELG